MRFEWNWLCSWSDSNRLTGNQSNNNNNMTLSKWPKTPMKLLGEDRGGDPSPRPGMRETERDKHDMMISTLQHSQQTEHRSKFTFNDTSVKINQSLLQFVFTQLNYIQQLRECVLSAQPCNFTCQHSVTAIIFMYSQFTVQLLAVCVCVSVSTVTQQATGSIRQCQQIQPMTVYRSLLRQNTTDRLAEPSLWPAQWNSLPVAAFIHSSTTSKLICSVFTLCFNDWLSVL